MQALLKPAIAPPPLSPAARRGSTLLLAGLVLFAYSLRVATLGLESLTIDEADAVYYARADLPAQVARITQPGENGPLYFLLLGFWARFAGFSEFSLRYFSLLPSVLCIPLLFVLGMRLLSRRAAVMAAFFCAMSSYLLFYAQMAKMYSLVLCLSLVAAYLLLRGLASGGRRTWAGYTLATTAALHTHVFGALLAPWHSLFVVAFLRWHRAALAPWLMSLAALTLPYVPIGWQRLAALEAPESLNRQSTGPGDLLGMLGALAQQYGTLFDGVPGEALSALFLLLTLGGAGALLRDPRRGEQGLKPVVFLSLGVVAPLTITYLMVARGAPLFAARYLVVTLPAFYLLWAAAADRMAAAARWLGLVALLGFALLNGARWAQTAYGGERFREDWRGAVAYLEQRATPGDLVLALHHSSGRAIGYYATKPLAVATLDAGEGRPLDPQRVGALPETGRVWLLMAHFELPDFKPVERWLDEYTQLVSHRWQTGVLVGHYLVKEESASRRPLFRVDAAVEGGLALREAQTARAPDRPGAPLMITLGWEARQAPLQPLALSVQVQDSQGRVLGEAAGPVGGQFYPTERWPQGFAVRDVVEVPLATDPPAAGYYLAVRVFEEPGRRPEPVEGRRPEPVEGRRPLGITGAAGILREELLLGPFQSP